VRAGTAAALALSLAALGCGGGDDSSPRDEAKATVQRYLAALGRGDAAAACREFTRESQDKLAEFGAEKLRLGARSCAATIDAALNAPNGPQLRRLGRARITRVEVRGDHAEVSVAGVGSRTELVRSDGAWRIASEPTGETD